MYVCLTWLSNFSIRVLRMYATGNSEESLWLLVHRQRLHTISEEALVICIWVSNFSDIISQHCLNLYFIVCSRFLMLKNIVFSRLFPTQKTNHQTLIRQMRENTGETSLFSRPCRTLYKHLGLDEYKYIYICIYKFCAKECGRNNEDRRPVSEGKHKSWTAPMPWRGFNIFSSKF